jgi:hypothetical protein
MMKNTFNTWRTFPHGILVHSKEDTVGKKIDLWAKKLFIKNS